MTQLKSGQLRKFNADLNSFWSDKLFVVINFSKGKQTTILMDSILKTYASTTTAFFTYKSDVIT